MAKRPRAKRLARTWWVECCIHGVVGGTDRHVQSCTQPYGGRAEQKRVVRNRSWQAGTTGSSGAASHGVISTTEKSLQLKGWTAGIRTTPGSSRRRVLELPGTPPSPHGRAPGRVGEGLYRARHPAHVRGVGVGHHDNAPWRPPHLGSTPRRHPGVVARSRGARPQRPCLTRHRTRSRHRVRRDLNTELH